MAIQTVDRYHSIQGETVRLYAQFERNGKVYDPFSISDVVILDPNDAPVTTVTPNRESTGVYFVDWAIGENQTLGDYTDQWAYYALSGSVLRTQENTFAINDGEWLVRALRTNWAGYLIENQVYTVTVSKWVKDTSGNYLGKDYVFYFSTKYNPLYINVHEIRNASGYLVAEYSDDEINMAAFKASLMARYIYEKQNNETLTDTPSLLPVEIWAWVRAATIKELLDRKLQDLIATGLSVQKTLGDLSIMVQGSDRLQAIKMKIDEMDAEMRKNPLFAATRSVASFVRGIQSTPWPLPYRNRETRMGESETEKKIHSSPWRRDYGTTYPEDDGEYT